MRHALTPGAPAGLLLAALLALLPAAALLGAAQDEPRPGDRAALDQLMGQVAAAISAERVADLEQLVAARFQLTLPDASVVTSLPELAVYLTMLHQRPSNAIAGLVAQPRREDPAVFLDADTAMARGTGADAYHLAGERTLVVPECWSAVAVRSAGAWRLASLHVGVDLLANPVLDLQAAAMKRVALGMVALAAFASLGFGIIIGRLTKRTPAVPLA
jgi:hypothetical protein